MHVVPRPVSYEGVAISESTTSEDLQELYRTVKPSGSAAISVMKLGTQILVTTTESPNWVGQFTPGDFVVYSDPIFVRLGPADDYVPYDSVYVT